MRDDGDKNEGYLYRYFYFQTPIIEIETHNETGQETRIAMHNIGDC